MDVISTLSMTKLEGRSVNDNAGRGVKCRWCD